LKVLFVSKLNHQYGNLEWNVIKTL